MNEQIKFNIKYDIKEFKEFQFKSFFSNWYSTLFYFIKIIVSLSISLFILSKLNSTNFGIYLMFLIIPLIVAVKNILRPFKIEFHVKRAFSGEDPSTKFLNDECILLISQEKVTLETKAYDITFYPKYIKTIKEYRFSYAFIHHNGTFILLPKRYLIEEEDTNKLKKIIMKISK